MRRLNAGLAIGIFILVPACNRSPSPELPSEDPPIVIQPFVRGATAVYSYPLRKSYVVTITAETLKRTPKWAEKKGNPPLSAKKAIEAANWLKNSLVEYSESYKWRLESCDLTPAADSRWYWVVHYVAQFQGGASSGISPFLKLVVLMDGSVIKPEISKE